MRRKPRHTPVPDRFWAKVDKSGDCWLWTSAVATSGYGVLNIDGRTVRAHRLSWALANGRIPDGTLGLHRCDVRLCVRPEHLFLGSYADNMADAAAKGRTSRGTHRPTASMTTSGVHEVRRLVASGLSDVEVAQALAITRSVVRNIRTGHTWAWLQSVAA